MKEIRTMQQRVFNWQRFVAGQPVCTSPSQRDEKFVSNQCGYIRSEWLDEYLGVTNVAATFSTPEELELLAADDIGDTAFTILGYLNALGVSITDADQFTPMLESRFASEVFITEAVNTAELWADPNAENGSELLRGLYGKPSTIAAHCLLRLNSLSFTYGFSFMRALAAVCDSNDTKLWTESEVRGGLPQDTVAVEVRTLPGDLRRWRVNDMKTAKLIKSPSFMAPDFANIRQVALPLTWF
jgi:hypothetical protein